MKRRLVVAFGPLDLIKSPMARMNRKQRIGFIWPEKAAMIWIDMGDCPKYDYKTGHMTPVGSHGRNGELFTGKGHRGMGSRQYWVLARLEPCSMGISLEFLCRQL